MTNSKLAKGNMTKLWRRVSRLLLAPCALVMAASCLQSCEKDVLTGQPAWLGNSIYERLEEGIEVEGKHQTFKYTLRLIDELELKPVLSKTGSRTLFVASDEAYENWFRTNTWGVRRFEDLTLSQKKMLLNNSMINNAYLLELMSNVDGNPPQPGLCMRRNTSASIFDTIPTMDVDKMPVNPFLKERLDSWSAHREKGKPINIVSSSSAAPMIHFLPEFMAKNKITGNDLEILSNGESTSIEDSWINGKKVISDVQTCKNGYIYVVSDVIESSPNMAEIIRNNPQTQRWSQLLDRFSVAWPAEPSMQADYRRLYNKSVEDTLYVLRYYFFDGDTKHPYLNMTPRGDKVPAYLPFNPGDNSYMWINSMGYDMKYDAGAMLVPTDEALDRWWNGEGIDLHTEYKTWDSIPALTLSKLLSVNMLPSFVESVPSKFHTIVDDAKVDLGVRPGDIAGCYMGCNGVVYLVNSVFAPSEYRSVVYPALSLQSKMSAIYYAIDNFDFGPFLNSMESKFSLFLPYNTVPASDGTPGKKVFRYLDPCTFGQPIQTLFEVYFDEETQMIWADLYDCTVDEAGEITVMDRTQIITATSSDILKDRMQDLIDNLIVVGLFNPDQEYYKTKAGSVIRVKTSGKSITVQGGWQMETGAVTEVKDAPKDGDVYDKTEKGNGISYGINEFNQIPQTASHSVLEILRAEADKPDSKCKLFYALLSEDDTKDALLSSETGSTTKYACVNSDNGNKNIRLFDNYNYTVYVPTDDAIQQLIDDGLLPTWDDFKAYGTGDEMSDKTTPAQDTIAAIIHDFLRYHIQDNSIYIGGEKVNAVKYETSKLNPKNKRFYSLEVTANNTAMTIKDQLGNTRNVVKENLYNRTSREYWLTGKSTSRSRQINSSSNAVVQQIDGVLLYDASQKKEWKKKLPND
ncbi:MAG: hypothetical protein KBT20_01840 [Bacteroidales bacterium]|nr:hypothetical protein [Candidatus Liminaster caballi]